MIDNPQLLIAALGGLLLVAVVVILLLLKRLGRKPEQAQSKTGVIGREALRPSKSKKLGKLSKDSNEDPSARLEETSNALFATLSHELRTPLNGLLGIVQMLNEERDDEDLQAIEGCARQMLAVISTLVNHTKIQEEWDELPEYREWISMYEVLEQLKRYMSFRAGLRGLDIEMVHQNSNLRLRCDSDHLKTIVENAILGSLECVSLVEIPKVREKMTISWEADEQGIKLSIQNPLETFEKDRRQKIKQVFKITKGEYHSRLKMEYLYWAVTTSLLERYEGSLFSREEPSGGVNTLLSFEMEQMQSSESAKKPVGGLSLDQGGLTSKAVSTLPKKMRILVAEDDPIARSLLSMVFKHMGQTADFATNGREVLDCVSQGEPYEVIFMDIDMPIMDGVSASIALRNGEAGEHGVKVPIVAVTAFNTLSDESKFKRAGMDFYLPKPVRLKDLRSVLVEVMRKTGHKKVG
ncbi:MAG: response regulator [Opitutaceae bacterium]